MKLRKWYFDISSFILILVQLGVFQPIKGFVSF